MKNLKLRQDKVAIMSVTIEQRKTKIKSLYCGSMTSKI